MSMHRWLVPLILFALPLTETNADTKAPSKNQVISAEAILSDLKKGNQRFLAKQPHHRDYQSEMLATLPSQHPEAVILSCMDSRNIPYLTFDQGIGDIFSLRVAGNVLNDDMLASMEYATKIAGAKLILVMGHTRCGAVQGACKKVTLGHLNELLEKIAPAVTATQSAFPTADCNDYHFIDAIAWQNVKNIMREIPTRSPVISAMLKKKQVRIVGAMYDLETGQVAFPAT